eukprot:5009306-Lingulodinium_polyedra.AAC.1
MVLRGLVPDDPWDDFMGIVALLENILGPLGPEEMANIMALRGTSLGSSLPEDVSVEDLVGLDETDAKDAKARMSVAYAYVSHIV